MTALSENLLTSVDAARILGLSSDMVRVLAREGRLLAAVASVRGVRMFRKADVEALAAERAGHRRLGQLIEQRRAGRTRLRVYGEMVDVLCRDGLVKGGRSAPTPIGATR
jgi:hypothetical protein